MEILLLLYSLSASTYKVSFFYLNSTQAALHCLVLSGLTGRVRKGLLFYFM